MLDLESRSMFQLESTIARVALLALLAVSVRADTPANCTFEDVRGTWIFEVGPAQSKASNDIKNCTGFTAAYKVKVNLLYPDIATDEFNNQGFWTIIYNQGFEVVVGGRKYFGFSVDKGKEHRSGCNLVAPGWSHDVLGHDWRCYRGHRSEPAVKHTKSSSRDTSLRFEHVFNSEKMVSAINEAQSSWKATRYSQFEGLTTEDLVKMAGGEQSKVASRPSPAPLSEAHKSLRLGLPANFDWRNVNGKSFVSPVRNQGSCGSCYAFSSMALAESRILIMSNKTQALLFSPQDIVECNPYSQGCEGGFPYLVAGKYGEDFGLVEEKCNPYRGSDNKCHTDPMCARHYLTDYKYVGGFYGGCNEVAMMEAIYNRGPVAVGFEVYKDFMSYTSGIYHHVPGLELGRFEPFELTNHAVLVVGWGEMNGERYWIVKNSWGTSWGMEGYFYIRRGNDECGIESMAVEATPVLRFD